MICTPLDPMQYLEGQALGDLELRVESFPFDPTGEGVVVTFKAVNVWTDALAVSGSPAVAQDVAEDAFGRFSFTLRTQAFPAADTPPAPYQGGFRFEDGDGSFCYAPPSARLLIEIQSRPAVAP